MSEASKIEGQYLKMRSLYELVAFSGNAALHSEISGGREWRCSGNTVFRLLLLCYLWISLRMLQPAGCFAWGAHPEVRLPPATRASSLAKLALQGEAQSDPLDAQEESQIF